MRKHKDWFYDNEADVKHLLEKKRAFYVSTLLDKLTIFFDERIFSPNECNNANLGG